MLRGIVSVLLVSCILTAACRSTPANPVESLDGNADVSGFTLQSLKGTRDGERLDVQAAFGDGARSLTVVLQFDVTPPPRLASGTWTGFGGAGEVQQRSVTFLGGQSGPPSIGGRFDLVGPDRRPLYRITIPLQELKNPL
jgi:hypothetical protein